MDREIKDSAEETKRLQRCINDLVSLVALPAVWSGSEPCQIIQTLVDALVPMLCLDIIYARVKDPVADTYIEVMRVAQSSDLKPQEIRDILSDWVEGDGQKSLPTWNRSGDKDISIFRVPVGVCGETGMIIAGSSRANFPEQTEILFLSAAANQASIWLKEARLCAEHKRTANQLEKEVAERSEGLAAANEELRKEIADRKKIEERLLDSEAGLRKVLDEIRKSEAKLRQVIDTIPTLAWCNLPDGPNEFLNKGWHEYTGLSPQESHGWGWQVAFHPEDLPQLMKRWQELLLSGEPGEIEARLRRHDGVYRWFLIRVEPFRDETGKIARWYGTSTDIEDRKQAEEAQRATERNLAAIIHTIPTAAWTTRPDGHCDFINQVWLDYAGMTAEQAQGWGWAEAIHPDDRKKLVEHWQSCLASGAPVDTEARIRRFDGSYRWFLFRASPLRDESGKIVKWYGTNIDIEDRKRGEEALRATELSWRQIVDNIPGLVATMGATGEVEFLNRQTLEYFGKTNEELKNWALIGAVHPDDLPRVIEARKKSIETGEIYEVEHRCRRADGVYRWFQVRGLPVRSAESTIAAWYLLLTDIDDRKRAEAQVEQAYLHLAEAQRLSKTGSFIADLVADDHNWSEEAFRIFEFDPATKVSVQIIRDMVHPKDLPSFDSVIARGMTGADVDFVFRIVTSQGAVKHIRGMARVIEQIAGRPLFIGALQDVTESKIAEEALEKARSELAHVTRVTTLNALTASIAHEINQPLSGIVSNGGACLRWLAGDAPDLDEVREAVRDIVRDGKRAAEVLARIRALVTKRTTPPREKLAMNETIQEVLTIVGDEAKRKSVTIRTRFADEVLPIFGDRVQLQQVLLNLVMNGLEAMSSVSERARELVVATRKVDAGQVQITVEDSGTGLDPNTIERIFDPFYTTKPSGMGMGLSISRSILQNHGGRLWAALNDGPGTSFHFTLPKHRQEERHAGVAGV